MSDLSAIQKPDGTFKGSRPARRSIVGQLQEENRALRARLGMTEPRSVTEWEGFGTPHLRAEMAARALMQEWLSPSRALKLLGFDKKDADDPAIQARILRSDEVLEILDSVMQPPKEQKRAIVERCAHTARFGDDDASVRATAQLARISGWVKPDAGANVTVSLVSLMNPGAAKEKHVEEIASDDVLSILGHEPGEPVRINTGDKAVERALTRSEDDRGV